MKNEIWKEIKGYEGIYSISSFGNVKRHERSVPSKNASRMVLKEKLLKIHTNHRGYSYVVFGVNNKSQNYSIHRLIAEYFIPNPENKEQVNHINGIKSDNRIENLEWATRKENMVHARENNLFPSDHNRGIKHGKAILNPKKVREIRELKDNGKSYKQLADLYSVSMGCIQLIMNRTNWKHVS